jgi:hypothetical protein
MMWAGVRNPGRAPRRAETVEEGLLQRQREVEFIPAVDHENVDTAGIELPADRGCELRG